MYFFLQESPLQFKVCAIFQLSIDFGESLNTCAFLPSVISLLASHETVIVAQRFYYGVPPPVVTLPGEDLEQALALAEEEATLAS